MRYALLAAVALFVFSASECSAQVYGGYGFNPYQANYGNFDSPYSSPYMRPVLPVQAPGYWYQGVYGPIYQPGQFFIPQTPTVNVNVQDTSPANNFGYGWGPRYGRRQR